MAPALSSRAAGSGAAVEPAGRTPPSCVRQATPSSMPRLFGLSPIGIGALLQAGGCSGLGFGGLGFASLGHESEPFASVVLPSALEIDPDHVVSGHASLTFHAGVVARVRPAVVPNNDLSNGVNKL